MSKVYLSFLGATPYRECIYSFQEKRAPLTRYVQEATLHFFCKDWDKTDRVLIFTTPLAFKRNWVDNGHNDGGKGLESCLSGTGLKAHVQRIDIPDGNNEEELWDIFEAVYNNLNNGDEVVFDITHAFRSIPMLAVVVLHYAKVLKNIRLRGIYYGAFESIGPFSKIEEMPPEERKAPILNLTAFDQLLDWTLAVDRFLGAGDAKAVSALATGAVAPILKETKGHDDAAAAVKGIANALNAYTKSISTCRGPDISRVVAYLSQELEKGKQVDLIKPLFPLFESIKKQVRLFKGNRIHDGIQSAKWCLGNNLIQQGYTIMFETLITFYAESISVDILDEKIRNIISGALQIFIQKKPEREWRGDSPEYVRITRNIIEVGDRRPELVITFDKLRKIRNDINHAGYKKDPLKANYFYNKLEQLIDEADRCLSDY